MKTETLFFCAWLGAIIVTGSIAQAQVVTQSPAIPESKLIGPGGVDMRSGEYVAESQDISIGPPGAGGLEFIRVPQKFKTFTSNWHYSVVKKPNPGSGNYYQLETQGVARTFFSMNGTTFTAAGITPPDGRARLQRLGSGSGAYYLYTAADGTTTRFQSSANDSGTHAEEIIRPNGLRYTFSYDSNGSRLRRVASNAGYLLIFEYFADSKRISKVCAINAATTTPPTAHSCPANVRAVRYTYSGDRVATVTDPMGAVWAATNNYVDSQTPFQESFFKPGASQPWLTNSYTANNGWGVGLSVSKQTFADGRFIDNTFKYVGRGELPNGLVLLGLGWSINGQHDTSIKWETYQKNNDYTPAVAGPNAITDPLGRVTRRSYDGAFSRIVSIAKPSGLSTHYSVTADRNISRILESATPDSGDPDLAVSYTYDCTQPLSCQKPATLTDARGSVTELTYAATHGGVLTETLPAPVSGGVRPQRRFSWGQYYAWYRNASGSLVRAPTPVWLLSAISECRTRATCAGTSDEIKTTFSYGASGSASNLLLVKRTVAAGDGSISATITYAYDANGDKISEDGPLPGSADTTVWKYDALRRVVGIIGPDPDGSAALRHRATRNTYDLAGRLTRVEQGTTLGQSDAQWAAFLSLESTETVYDALDRKTKVVRRGGQMAFAVTQYSYDDFGRLECAAVRMNPASFASLPASACAASAGATPDRITRHTYDAADQLIRTQRGVGTPDASDVVTNSYTINGKLATLTDGQGNRTTFEYDGHDRLAKVRFPVGAVGQFASSTTDFELLAYDGNGNVIQRRLRDGQLIKLSYDALNRLVTKNLPAGEIDVGYTYDLQGHPLATTQGAAVVSTWDALGRRLSETTPLGTMAYEYDLAGRRTRITWPDGFHVTHDYLLTNELAAIREMGSTDASALLARYTYDDRGNVIGITRANAATTTITMDALSRPISWAHDLAGTAKDLTATFAYNAAHQVVEHTRSKGIYAWARRDNKSTAYSLNGLNQFTNAGGTSLAYDARGNLVSLGTRALTYSSENRLTADSGGTAFQYDATGRLVQVNKGGLTTRFLYDGTDLVAEYGPTNVLQRRYVHGPGLDEPLVWYEGSGINDRRWFHQDERDNVIAITNGLGAAIGVNTYDEFGIPAATNLGRFSFTGQIWLPEVGLYHFKARTYSPELGRFLQTDPIGYGDEPNLYGYANNDPLNATDPTGTSIWTKLFKLARAVWKGGDVASEFADNIQDVATVFDPSATLLEKSLAVVSLASEALPVSVSDAKDVGRIVEVIKKHDDPPNLPSPKGAANPKVAAALKRGQEAHKERQYPDGFKKEQRLPSGKRMDAYNPETREVVELKPNNPRAVSRGETQVKQYCSECDATYGEGHVGSVETYDP